MSTNNNKENNQPAKTTDNRWNKPVEKITVGVIIGTIVLLIGFTITHFMSPKKNNGFINKQSQQQINAPNSVISIDQKGGITAETVTINEIPAETRKYSFDGALTIFAPGEISTFTDEKRDAFNTIVSLEKERKYSDLISFCKKQIAETPKWLTPYLFLGLAQANMGMINDAISNFEYVIENAPYDPNYQQAQNFIKQLKNK